LPHDPVFGNHLETTAGDLLVADDCPTPEIAIIPGSRESRDHQRGFLRVQIQDGTARRQLELALADESRSQDIVRSVQRDHRFGECCPLAPQAQVVDRDVRRGENGGGSSALA